MNNIIFEMLETILNLAYTYRIILIFYIMVLFVNGVPVFFTWDTIRMFVDNFGEIRNEMVRAGKISGQGRLDFLRILMDHSVKYVLLLLTIIDLTIIGSISLLDLVPDVSRLPIPI